MSVWDTYAARINAHGGSIRETHLKREKRIFREKMQHSLSYFTVTIDDVEQNVMIVDTDNLNEKFIYSLPDEDVRSGGVVYYAGGHWLVTERDSSNEVYTRSKMCQCNYLLRWIDDDDEIHEQWCIVEDGTKLRHARWRVIAWHTGNGM